jgi:hypothetical protein
MLFLLNCVIILLLLIMMAIWATYGFFSAFIQLIIVIASGTIALALWEPVTYMLIGRMPVYAQGVGLLAPFVLLLILLRVVFDKVCRANVHMPRIADQLGGAACGFCSGVLAFGMLLNGANFLPMHREVMGWEPYLIAGNEINDNPEQRLWSFTRIHEWSAGFYSMLSTGAMSPMGGTPLAEARPDLAKRALITRLAADENQMRSAHPSVVEVTGVYAVPATPAAVMGLVQRSTILAFLQQSYELPEGIVQDESGNALVNAILADLASRAADPQANGKPSEMLNIEAIMAVARTPEFEFPNASNVEQFPAFVEMVSEKLGRDMVERLKGALGENKVLYVVDTRWNKQNLGTYNSDGKLRVAMSQVSLQTEDDMLPPIAYSTQYSQNTGGRIFTEVISEASDISTRDAAYANIGELSIGWVFSLDKTDAPQRLFVRELRFELSDLDKPAGAEGGIVNQNIGAVAQVFGAPLLPDPDADEEAGTSNAPRSGANAVKIAGTNTFAEVTEKLPSSFAAAASSLNLDKSQDPWVLQSGKADKVIAGRGGKKSSVSEIAVSSSDRLVRIELDPQQAKSLLGRAIGLAENLNVLQVEDEGGNRHDAIGFALLRSDRSMQIDIRQDVISRGVSASELPQVRAGESLMVYFQVPIGKKLDTLHIGGQAQAFEEVLAVEREQR